MKYSIILPCKDEESTIGIVISKARKILPNSQITEIIVVDNNSKDRTASIAKSLGAKVVVEKTQGYGAALTRGFREARGEYVIMCDADNTYDFNELPSMIKYVDKKYDIIMGNRLNNKMQKGAMPTLHKYIGNPFLSLMMRSMFNISVKDTHSGFRIIKRESLKKLELESTGMELASEMLIKASKKNMKIKEVNISYYPRLGESKLNSFNDGWKHLKMMLLYSPNHLFLIPGLVIFGLGIIISIAMLFGPISILGLKFDWHPAIIGSLLSMLGYQLIMLAVFAKTYRSEILGEKSQFTDKLFKYITLERSIVLGSIIAIIGIIIGLIIIMTWIKSGFGQLFELRKSLFALTLIMLGAQTVYSGFMLSILGIKRK
jgi:glycosyltransferase involved in cell wall biosynthesis